MGLSLTTITIFIGLAILYAAFLPSQWRKWAIFLVSIFAVYWLQPSIKVRWIDFFLPTLTILITVGSWYLTWSEKQVISKEDKFALLLILGVVVGLSLFRLLPSDYRWLVASRPPPLQYILLLMTIFVMLILLINRSELKYSILLIFILSIFLIIKTDSIATWMSGFLRNQTQQDTSLASAVDLNWLGFSYLAFRLLHTIRDRQTGILPTLSLQEYVSYVLFFSSFIAGPIDRVERFVNDFRSLVHLSFQSQYTIGISRISIGLFKKFIIADTLAQGMALDAINAAQIENTLGAWLILYGYSLRLFFDFSGYSDIAIGIGALFGIQLPENFNQPYTKTSITKFWQSWHITLSNWVRTYIFSPLSRHLLRREPKPSPILIVLITQLTTMIVIGLWHGVTINFLIWGIWHGIGLFIHKQWTDNTRGFYRQLREKPLQARIANMLAWFITFHFVVLGWVWFALPNYQQAISIFSRLFGFVS